jgi:hypothetical protein
MLDGSSWAAPNSLPARKDCFINQCESAGSLDLPIQCYGDKGKCNQVFSMISLREILPLATLEKLLVESFDSYIQGHPEGFQNCATPDCPQVYRVSSNRRSFECPSCLSCNCTTCSSPTHYGMTCAEYKTLATDGTEEFNRWKRENDVRQCPKCTTAI